MRGICLKIMVLGWFLSASAAVYYVDSQSGLDTRAGTSEATAWQSLSKVNGFTFVAGDTVKFKCGGTWTGQLTLDNSGTSGRPVVYTSYGTGNKPVLTWPAGRPIVNVTGSYIVFDGFSVHTCQVAGNAAGVLTATGSSYCIMRNLDITKTPEGVWIGGTHHQVTGCYLHDLVMGVNTQGGNDDCGARGITISSASDIDLSYNRFLNCVAPSYDYGQDGGAVEIWRAVSRVAVHHNNMASCAGVMEVGGKGDAVSDIAFYYNVIFYCGLPGNAWFGIHTNYPTNEYGIVPGSFRVDNNTVVSSGSVWGMGTWMTMRNNVFYNSSGGGTQGNNFTGNPLFVNISARDYHLQPGSPCINAGASLGYTLDYDGVAVPRGGAPDIGAFEFIPGDTPAVAVPEILPAGGAFTGQVTVTISCATPGAAIRYTTNGSEPTATSTLYASPFVLNTTATVKAKGFAAGKADSPTASAVFSILPPECRMSSATWQGVALPAHRDTFTVEFDATPATLPLDGVIALSLGPALNHSQMALAVRFNAQGRIDAANGGAYTAARTLTYVQGMQYHIRMPVTVPAHRYRVYVAPVGEAESALGLDYAFCTAQGAVPHLTYWDSYSSPGELTVCNLAITAGSPVHDEARAGRMVNEKTAGETGRLYTVSGAAVACGKNTGIYLKRTESGLDKVLLIK